MAIRPILVCFCDPYPTDDPRGTDARAGSNCRNIGGDHRRNAVRRCRLDSFFWERLHALRTLVFLFIPAGAGKRHTGWFRFHFRLAIMPKMQYGFFGKILQVAYRHSPTEAISKDSKCYRLCSIEAGGKKEKQATIRGIFFPQ